VANEGLNHAIGHQFESLFQMAGENVFWPKEIMNKVLKGIQIIKKTLRRKTAGGSRKSNNDYQTNSWAFTRANPW